MASAQSGQDDKIVYPLPAHDQLGAERYRLNLQHNLLKKKMGGLFIKPEAVERVLATKANGDRPGILDVGTGTGQWAIDMARQFPQADVLGIDLNEPHVDESTPSNCRFEKHDMNSGMLGYTGRFDVIHARAIASGSKDWRATIQEFEKILRPGGILLLFDPDLAVRDANRQIITAEEESDPGFTWLAKNGRIASKLFEAHAKGIYGYLHYDEWFKDTSGWGAYGQEEIYTPIGPWDKDDMQVGEMLRENILQANTHVRPMYIAAGQSPEYVDFLHSKITDELVNLRAHMYFRWIATWAIKRS